MHAKTTTNTGVLKEVAETPGAIGYADLSQARNVANGGFTGQSPQRFWMEVEASAKVKVSSKGTTDKRKYADPSSNGDVVAAAESNCKKTEYSNGVGSFPPPSVKSNWNEVAAKRESKSYPICGLTYVLALTNYEAYASHGGNAAEAQTVKDYVGFIGGKDGGARNSRGTTSTRCPRRCSLPPKKASKGSKADEPPAVAEPPGTTSGADRRPARPSEGRAGRFKGPVPAPGAGEGGRIPEPSRPAPHPCPKGR